ncbi:MAG: diaminopimelate decarboxylase [Clostridia bacterium]|nr:diaminopimelate decarboxylase [Clostridia bacterium]
MISSNISVNETSHLCFAGVDVTALAARYGTPLYLLDEDRIRERCRTYKSAMAAAFGPRALPLYAGKALCVRDLYRIMREEEMGIDVVSSGEIYTAKSAGFPMERAYFHGNGKTDADVAFAMEAGVGTFVCDSREELDAISRFATERGITQRVLLRLAPGIDPHTHRAISTGSVDSKFGAAIETGGAEALCRAALSLSGVRLVGFHCHIGSQIFDTAPFLDAVRIMFSFAADMRERLGYTAEEINLGGGLGVRYLAEHPTIDYAACIAEIGTAVTEACRALSFPLPAIRMEPGRSIVADAGMTVYTVGSVKEIPGFKNYVAVDGGMPDNPRYALYESPYTVLPANRMNEKRDFVCSIAGRCCESGDLIQEGVALPRLVRGDLVAVLTTGAYNYSMASNYNRIPRPPMVLLSGGHDRLIVRRESFEDLLRNEL